MARLPFQRLLSAPKRGVVLTDPGGNPFVSAFPEGTSSGVALGGDGNFHVVGDVFGDAGAIDQRIAVFNADGFHIEDGGYTIADILALIAGGGTGDVVGPASAVDDRIATFDGTTGKLIQDGGSTIAGVLATALTAAKGLFPINLLTNLLADGATAAYSTMTSKGVPYVNASGIFAIDTAQLAWDHVNLRFGINRASPGYPLEVRGTPVDIGFLIHARPSATGSAFVQLQCSGANNQAGFSFNQGTNSKEWRMAVVGNDGDAMRWAGGSGGADIMLYLTQNMNMILGGTRADPSAGTFCFVLKNGTAGSTPAADSSLLYANDVSSSSELFARNEANQVVRLTGRKDAITVSFDGGGAAIAAGSQIWVQVPFDITLTEWRLTADASGSIVIDVWRDSYTNYPPDVSDTIAGTEKPTLSSATKNEDTNLTSFTTSIAAGDFLKFNVDSATTVTKVVLQLIGRRTS